MDPVREALENGASLTARLTPGVVVQPLKAHNVVAMIEGRDPSAGMVVVGAHLDHDGVDASGQIYNGADDNASGTAAVLAVAAAFARASAAGERPVRAVVFAFWNGEEQGSLGAEQFLAEPMPNRPIVANINLDMVGRAEDIAPGDPRFYGFDRTTAGRSANVLHMLGYSYSPDLARIVDRANGSVRLNIKEDYDRGAQNLLQRSDHWPFLKRGVPAIFLTTGLHPDYHTPADDTERIDFPKLERIAELAGRAAWLTADGEAPRFKGK
jgi:Zn-dependent M28 family amino/carboxypeptidase